MTINSHVETFAGLPVFAYDPVGELPAVPASVAWRLSVEDSEAPTAEFEALITGLLDRVPPGSIQALLVGEWGSAYEEPPPIDLLASLAPRLSGLRALYLAELTFDECEISWLHQGDVTPLLVAFPQLEILRVRGTDGLSLTPGRYPGLRELAFESGGLPAGIVRAVAACELPALEWLELWLGTEMYGGDATVGDLAPILLGERIPALRHLGLRDASIVDAVAAAVAVAPVVAQLDVLDLSMGALTDNGARALLGGQSLTHLTRLDLHYHFLSEELQQRVRSALPGVEVDLSDPQEAEDDDGEPARYVAVGE
jgi:hypothetical protein